MVHSKFLVYLIQKVLSSYSLHILMSTLTAFVFFFVKFFCLFSILNLPDELHIPPRASLKQQIWKKILSMPPYYQMIHYPVSIINITMSWLEVVRFSEFLLFINKECFLVIFEVVLGIRTGRMGHCIIFGALAQ